MRLSKRRLDDARREAAKVRDAEKALLILQGYTPCPECKGSRVAMYPREMQVAGRNYHFKRSCRWCSQTETPGFFSKTEANEYGITEWRTYRGLGAR